MNLYLHLLIHLGFGLLAGLIAWRVWRKSWVSFLSGVIGGFLVDLDHLIDYFLAFGWNFQLDYFLAGYQFLKSDRIYVLFHAWEYVIIFLALIFIFKNRTVKSLFLGAALGLLFHLTADVALNEMPFWSYSISYRLKKNFSLESLVYPEHWLEHKKLKEVTPLP